MSNAHLQELVEHNALLIQRQSSLMQLLGNTSDGAFRIIMTPGTASLKSLKSFCELLKEHSLDLTKELERYERQFQWHVEKALGCITALDTGEGKS